MKTVLGNELPENIRGVLYICEYDKFKPSITVIAEMLFEDAWEALNAFAEIPNPESQLITAPTFEMLCERLERLHTNMVDMDWLVELGYCL